MTQRRFSPPPTKFGGTGAQAKPAPARTAPSQIPPTRYGAVSAVQAKPAGREPWAARPAPPPPPPRPGMAIQMMDKSIGERIRQRHQEEKWNGAHSSRLREKYGNGSGRIAPTYSEPKQKGRWDGKTRPGWFDETWESLASDAMADPMEYTCVACGDSPIYRLRDKGGTAASDDATIDHKTDWKTYLHNNGAPDEEGYVTTEGAAIAYNDIDNLQIMCRSCNAKKNGPKNVFD